MNVLADVSGALLITGDKDFGELVFRQRLLHAGVVLVRLAGLKPETKANIVSAVFHSREAEMRDAFVVISPGAVRIRRKV